LQVEALMMAIAAVVPHYLLGLAAGAGILGMFMPIAGYVIPTSDIPKPFWLYPMHYLGYHTYSLNGMMSNEFSGTDGWGCPCEIQPEGCSGPCEITGQGVLNALRWASGRNKWCAPARRCRCLQAWSRSCEALARSRWSFK
jgi:hypothetical protein